MILSDGFRYNVSTGRIKPRGGQMTYFVEGLSGHGQPESKVRRIGSYDSLPDAITTSLQSSTPFPPMPTHDASEIRVRRMGQNWK